MSTVSGDSSKTIWASEPLYGEVVDFLYQEAELLDTGRMEEWLGLLAEDIRYSMPIRLTRRRGSEVAEVGETDIFDENFSSLTVRVARLSTNFAWAEDPPSRTRHLISNIRVSERTESNEVEARSYFLVYRNRGTSSTADIFSGERRDRLRRTNGGWRLAARVITLDQALVGARNISFLI